LTLFISVSVLPADVQQVVVIKEEVPWSSSLDQQDPELLHIKEEEEELWTSQKGEQLPFTVVTVKNEDDEEKPQSSHIHQIRTKDNRETEPPISSSAKELKTAADGDNSGGLQSASSLDTNCNLQPDTDELEFCETEVSIGDDDSDWSDSGSETEASDKDWKQTPESDVNHDGSCNTAKKSVSCSECSKQFISKQSLMSHMRVHIGGQPFACIYCGKGFNHNSHLKTHMRVHTGEKPFGCDVCGKRFSERGNLSSHMRVHTGEKPFVCDDCGKRFNTNTNLKAHIRVHTGEKPFGCEVCGKRFKQKANLKTHRRIHTGEKPFGCDVCGKRFSERGTLSSHLRVHTGEKPFACNDCGKRFNTNTNLKAHTRVHTGEKPFGCDVCGKRFNQNTTLKKHKRIHTGEKLLSAIPAEKDSAKSQILRNTREFTQVKKPLIVKNCFAKMQCIT